MQAVNQQGVLNLVSVGPGFEELIVPRAIEALRDSDVIVAYELYLRWIAPHIAGKEIHTPPLTQERERALLAIEKQFLQALPAALFAALACGFGARIGAGLGAMAMDGRWSDVAALAAAMACAGLCYGGAVLFFRRRLPLRGLAR